MSIIQNMDAPPKSQKPKRLRVAATLNLIVRGAGRPSEAMVHLDATLRLKTNDAGTRSSLQPGWRVLGKLQEREAAGQR